MHRSNQRGFGTLRCLLATLGLLAVASAAVADPVRWTPGDTANVLPGTVEPDHFVAETVLNLGTDPFGIVDRYDATYDCAPLYLGFAQTRYDFTLTACARVQVWVEDCCIAGDLYGARVNNRDVDEDGDGNPNNHEEDTVIGREEVDVPVGVRAFLGETDLAAGNWTVRIRDHEWTCRTTYAGCPAGFWVTIQFVPCEGDEPCVDPCDRVGGAIGAGDPTLEALPCDYVPPSTGPCDLSPIEAKLDDEFRFTDDDELREFRDEINAQLAALEAKLDDMATGLCDVVRLLHTPSGIREADCAGVHYAWNADGTVHD